MMLLLTCARALLSLDVAQSAQMSSKDLTEIHATSEAVRCPIDPPRKARTRRAGG
jgi:hypothetical protein